MSGRARRSLRPAWRALALLVPAVACRAALACPACAGREDGGPALLLVYAAMVASPFVAALVVLRVVRSLTARELT